MSHKSNMSDSAANSQGNGSNTAVASASYKTRSSISNEFYDFLADIEDFVKNTTALTGEDLARAKEKLGERVAAAKESVADMGSSVAAQARKTADVTNTYVHEEPWKAIGIGAAVGLLLGFALARR